MSEDKKNSQKTIIANDSMKGISQLKPIPKPTITPTNSGKKNG